MVGQYADFLGAFALLRRDDRYLLVKNERRIAGRLQHTWDLPGGHVEPGELLHDAVRRELFEETQLHCQGEPQFVFCQEGERIVAAARQYAWRSFFFVVAAEGEPVASHEVLDVAWLSAPQIERQCRAPYHDSFRQWLRHGGQFFRSLWCD